MIILRILIGVMCMVVASCAWSPQEFNGSDAPGFVAPVTEKKSSPRIALMLGSGGVRGFAHIGVIKALQANGIEPDIIVGASAGAMVGALYASGIDGKALEKIALELNALSLMDVSLVKRGMVRGDALQNFIDEKVGGRSMENLGKPFAAVALQKSKNALQIFNHGNTGEAVRASSAIPGRIMPVWINCEEFVDADMLSPVPINVAKQLGAQIVIAVDVSAHLTDTPDSAPEKWRARDAFRKKLVDAEAPQADILIHPNPGYYACWQLACRQRVIDAGEADTLHVMARIKAVVETKPALTQTSASQH